MRKSSRLIELFSDEPLVEKIKMRLPYLFQIAELESSRAGKTGMEVGSMREKIIGALLIYKFGEDNVEVDIPITKSEEDVRLFGNPISIKTFSGRGLRGVKLIWTVDTQKANEFRENYYPRCDMILIHINWESKGGFYYIPLETQIRVFGEIGREAYIRLPKSGTNPRGVEITKEAIVSLIKDSNTKYIEIHWHRTTIDTNPYKKWIDLWKGELI